MPAAAAVVAAAGAAAAAAAAVVVVVAAMRVPSSVRRLRRAAPQSQTPPTRPSCASGSMTSSSETRLVKVRARGAYGQTHHFPSMTIRRRIRHSLQGDACECGARRCERNENQRSGWPGEVHARDCTAAVRTLRARDGGAFIGVYMCLDRRRRVAHVFAAT